MNSKIQVFYNKLKRDQVLLLKTVNDFLDKERVSMRNGVPRRNCIRELQDVIKTSKGKLILNILLEYALESDILHKFDFNKMILDIMNKKGNLPLPFCLQYLETSIN